jgi:CelD/BcsL family acetyltransferase involved in cellulose biosynthesis
MNLAAHVTVATPAETAVRAPPRIARVAVYDTLTAAEHLWSRLQCPLQYSTLYQRVGFLDSWYRHVGTRCGFTPAIVVAFDVHDDPLMVLPLATVRQHGMCYAFFMGGKHSNLNMPLYRRDFAVSATRADMEDLLARLHRSAPSIDALILLQQPMSWHGIPNPLSLLPRQRSVNVYPRLTFPQTGNSAPPPISNSLRRRLKGKERKLRALPGYRHFIAESDAEIQHLLDFFFRVKPVHMAAQKLPNVFAEPGVEAFVRDICSVRSPDGKPMVVMHALACDDEIIAFYAGMEDGTRYTMMFNSYTLSANGRYSPGLILMRYIVDHYAEHKLKTLDLGIGDADYKRMFCKEQEPLFDNFLPLTPRGRISALALATANHAKRWIRQTPALFTLASWARYKLQR